MRLKCFHFPCFTYPLSLPEGKETMLFLHRKNTLSPQPSFLQDPAPSTSISITLQSLSSVSPSFTLQQAQAFQIRKNSSLYAPSGCLVYNPQLHFFLDSFSPFWVSLCFYSSPNTICSVCSLFSVLLHLTS